MYEGFGKKPELVILDRDITAKTDELAKLKKQNKKLEARFLPKPGSEIAQICAILVEIDIMQAKQLDAENSLMTKYSVDFQQDAGNFSFLDDTPLPSPRQIRKMTLM